MNNEIKIKRETAQYSKYENTLFSKVNVYTIKFIVTEKLIMTK